MARNANQEILGRDSGIRKLPGFLNGQTVLTEMDTAGGLRKCNVQSIIHENANRTLPSGWRSCCALDRCARQGGALLTGKIFFAYLNPIDTRGCGILDLMK
jgi:hypothetical protein